MRESLLKRPGSRIVGYMTSTKSPTRRKSVALLLLLLPIAAVLLYVLHLSGVQRDHFTTRADQLAGIEESPVSLRKDGAALADVWLRSSSDLRVRMRLLLPPEAQHGRTPVVLLLGGHRTGRHAVDLVSETRGIAFAAIDYPYEGEHSLSGVFDVLSTVPDIQEAFLDTPPALMLAMDWLSRQPWFDPQRAEVAGISLGVPFAAVAGALDMRFTRVWLIHGAIDNFEWVMHAARERIDNELLRRFLAGSALLFAYGNSFKTNEWLGEIAPRPTVLVAARNDDRVPHSSMDLMINAAEADHVRLLWTEGRHIGPDRGHELQQLITIVADEIVLGTRPAEPAATDFR